MGVEKVVGLFCDWFHDARKASGDHSAARKVEFLLFVRAMGERGEHMLGADEQGAFVDAHFGRAVLALTTCRRHS
jgi:hypothetical protein